MTVQSVHYALVCGYSFSDTLHVTRFRDTLSRNRTPADGPNRCSHLCNSSDKWRSTCPTHIWPCRWWYTLYMECV